MFNPHSNMLLRPNIMTGMAVSKKLETVVMVVGPTKVLTVRRCWKRCDHIPETRKQAECTMQWMLSRRLRKCTQRLRWLPCRKMMWVRQTE